MKNNSISNKDFYNNPQLVSKEFMELDEKMQEGYQFLMDNKHDKAVKSWIEVWNKLMDYMKNNNLKTFASFDNIYNGTQFVVNWLNDFENCLCNIVANAATSANANDGEILEVYGSLRISMNEQIISFTDDSEELTLENAKRAIAETHFYLGNIKKGEELFEKYLSENPTWGWGWIGLSDQYWLMKAINPDFSKGEEVLLKALNVSNLVNREDVEVRLLNLYSESEQNEKLNKFEKEINRNIRTENSLVAPGTVKYEKNHDIINNKIGRNEPCYCGSGKKYKKCCGK
ncbi:SEC-C domain-containing protein [Clostridium bowmanii]|uniref:tetratricopeptide repeat protein n=1 Tax=Clostridium bowmanii TaxID=132925 RepID=UPI001CD5589B|nr:SEC-C metal-binding domain-containing protein [Clostridium bowmanii]MCA1075871.1 SEC-C domain-containing protein [Clostridium bowmanii]